MKWCEHIKKDGGCWFIANNMVTSDWVCCPICGAKKPEPKSLAEELCRTYWKSCKLDWSDVLSGMKEDWQRVADKAREYILNDIKEGNGNEGD